MSELNTNPIADLNRYNLSMSKSLIDKIFFMDKIDDTIKVIVDYGCADGALIRFLAPLFPDMFFIGYDKNEEMIGRAAEANTYENCVFYSHPMNFLAWLHANHHTIDECALNLSSIIHEVYSYSTKDEIEEFWHFVNFMGFKYIIIRDMCLDENAHRASLKEDLIKVKSNYSAAAIQEFEQEHGSICDNYNLIHFLLKYRYKDNWEREVKENYLPCSTEYIASQIRSCYSLEYYDHYILPFLANVVKRDFDITIKDYTHVKFIYKLKG